MGFALGTIKIPVVITVIVFGVVSVAMSLAGLELGAKIGSAAGELLAAAVLIGAGAAMAAGWLLPSLLGWNGRQVPVLVQVELPVLHAEHEGFPLGFGEVQLVAVGIGGVEHHVELFLGRLVRRAAGVGRDDDLDAALLFHGLRVPLGSTLVSDLAIRAALMTDVPGIVAMLADDMLGALREDPSDLSPYYAAFDRVTADPTQHLLVAERGGELLGTMQLFVLHGLASRGSTRVQVESVRIAASARGAGLGTALMEWAIEFARSSGASVVQLTSHSSRSDAHRFYQRLGFEHSHHGYKLMLR